MKENEYSIMETTIYCDGDGCDEEETVEWDYDKPNYSQINEDLKDIGWRSFNLDGVWVDMCLECFDSNNY